MVRVIFIFSVIISNLIQSSTFASTEGFHFPEIHEDSWHTGTCPGLWEGKQYISGFTPLKIQIQSNYIVIFGNSGKMLVRVKIKYRFGYHVSCHIYDEAGHLGFTNSTEEYINPENGYDKIFVFNFDGLGRIIVKTQKTKPGSNKNILWANCIWQTKEMIEANKAGTIAYQAHKIYTIGSLINIVADNSEWSCQVSTKSDPSVNCNNSHGDTKYVIGRSRLLPISFVFYVAPLSSTGSYVENFLKTYAIKTNSVLFDVKQKVRSKNSLIVECRYYNNTESGYLQYHWQEINGIAVVMFSKIDNDSIDDESRETLYKSAHDLITPVYNP